MARTDYKTGFGHAYSETAPESDRDNILFNANCEQPLDRYTSFFVCLSLN